MIEDKRARLFVAFERFEDGPLHALSSVSVTGAEVEKLVLQIAKSVEKPVAKTQTTDADIEEDEDAAITQATNSIGDDESPASAGNVNVGDTAGDTPTAAGDVNLDGTTVKQLSLGSAHTCVLLDTGGVRCWGAGGFGQLGYGSNESIGDNESPLAEDVSIL